MVRGSQSALMRWYNAPCRTPRRPPRSRPLPAVAPKTGAAQPVQRGPTRCPSQRPALRASPPRPRPGSPAAAPQRAAPWMPVASAPGLLRACAQLLGPRGLLDSTLVGVSKNASTAIDRKDTAASRRPPHPRAGRLQAAWPECRSCVAGGCPVQQCLRCTLSAAVARCLSALHCCSVRLALPRSLRESGWSMVAGNTRYCQVLLASKGTCVETDFTHYEVRTSRWISAHCGRVPASNMHYSGVHALSRRTLLARQCALPGARHSTGPLARPRASTRRVTQQRERLRDMLTQSSGAALRAPPPCRRTHPADQLHLWRIPGEQAPQLDQAPAGP